MSKPWYIYVHEVGKERSPDKQMAPGLEPGVVQGRPVRLLLSPHQENASAGVGAGGGVNGSTVVRSGQMSIVDTKWFLTLSRRPSWKNTVGLYETERRRPLPGVFGRL